jgi:hypothetical protein
MDIAVHIPLMATLARLAWVAWVAWVARHSRKVPKTRSDRVALPLSLPIHLGTFETELSTYWATAYRTLDCNCRRHCIFSVTCGGIEQGGR